MRGIVNEEQPTKVTMNIEKAVRGAQFVSPIVEPNYPEDTIASTPINAGLDPARNIPF